MRAGFLEAAIAVVRWGQVRQIPLLHDCTKGSRTRPCPA